MSIEAPNPIDEDPDADLLGPPRPGETDEEIRFRHRRYQDRQFLLHQRKPVSAEDDARNREMLKRLGSGDFSEPDPES